MPLFQNSVLNKYLKSIATDTTVENAYTQYKAYFHNAERQENIRNSKEEQFQEGFLRELFVKILGYTINPEPNFNLTTELKNIKDSKKVDGAILKDSAPIAVIELKGTNTTDLSKIENQAFGYKNNHAGVQYVITSNFEKLRFYIDNAIDFEDFNLFNLSPERFSLLWLLLAKDNLLKGLASQMKGESLIQEEQITKQLYKDYSLFRKELFNSIAALNPQHDKLFLFKKTQKLLDRFLFIFFAEDRLLLPPNSTRQILQQWNDLREKYDEYFPLYDRFKKYFGYLDTGHKGKQHDIFAYNGGLFAPDEILDNIKIDDLVLYTHTQKLSDYDFQSDVDVNILGHIFENSLNEIEELAAEIENQDLDKSQTKRKKDGVFYTPKYITKYIVDNTVGKLCSEKKTEFGIDEEEYTNDKRKTKATKKTLLDKLEAYRSWLLGITICDPACGSGAFLNQALDFLITEHRYIDELQAKLLGDSLILSDIENSILERNLYGVDINEESVEIAKLSLWLRTARPDRKLTSLNNNIKCGNSLIDDPEIAGDKAFNWANEFPEVFGKGGFDVVIGNPPYVSKTWSDDLKKYIKLNYQTAEYQLDLYVCFMELAVKTTKHLGMISFIVPNSWLKNLMFSQCRHFLIESVSFEVIIPNLDKIFEDASVDTMIFSAKKASIKNDISIGEFVDNSYRIKHKVSQSRFLDNDRYVFDIEINNDALSIFKKIKDSSILLTEICDITRGINPYDKYRGQSEDVIKNKLYHSEYQKDETFVPEIRGKHVFRYIYLWDNESYVSYGDWLAAPRESKYFEGERILCRQILGTHLNCCIISEKFIIDQSVFIAKLKENYHDKFLSIYILGNLTSKLISYYFRYKANEFDALFPKIKIGEFRDLPVFPLQKEKQINIGQKVDYMMQQTKSLQKIQSQLINLLESNFPEIKINTKLKNWYDLDFKAFLKELTKQKIKIALKDQMEWQELFDTQRSSIQALQAEIDRTDKEIDKMVYELYGLTDEEIAIVEGAV